jgi:hypothetical protein
MSKQCENNKEKSMKLFGGVTNISEVNLITQIYMERYDDQHPLLPHITHNVSLLWAVESALHEFYCFQDELCIMYTDHFCFVMDVRAFR